MEVIGNSLLAHAWIEGANGSHVVFGQFRGGTFPAMSRAPFARFIGLVVGICAEKQVGRITTRRIVAGMAHVQSIWDRTVRMFIGKAMREKLAIRSITNDAIAASVDRAIPRPARIWFAGLVEVPKAVSNRSAAIGIGTCARTQPLAFPANSSQMAVGTERQFHPKIILRMEVGS